MFKLRHLKGNTYYLACFSNCGVYDLGNGEVILIDSCDHKKSTSDLDRALVERGWRVKTIINTHGHIDHVAGNEYFKLKYNCDIYARGMSRGIAQNPCMEGAFIFLGLEIKRNDEGLPLHIDPEGKRTYFNIPVDFLTEETLPEGFEMLPLPGHSFDMVGIKTPDNVWFLGDSIVHPDIFDDYYFPLFLFPNAAIKTCRELLPKLEGDLFVPSHVPPLEDVTEAALANAEGIEWGKEYILSKCDGKSFEDIFSEADNELDLKLTQDRYAKMAVMVKALLTALIEDGAIKPYFEGGRLVYGRI